MLRLFLTPILLLALTLSALSSPAWSTPGDCGCCYTISGSTFMSANAVCSPGCWKYQWIQGAWVPISWQCCPQFGIAICDVPEVKWVSCRPQNEDCPDLGEEAECDHIDILVLPLTCNSYGCNSLLPNGFKWDNCSDSSLCNPPCPPPTGDYAGVGLDCAHLHGECCEGCE